MKVIILAGGNGTRLFPLSRENKPKQFLKIDSDKSLLIETITRFCYLVTYKDIVIVTSVKYINIVKKELSEYNMDDVHVIAEPVSRNTAPAVALAIKYCLTVLNSPKDEVIFISTSDHIIRPKELFNRAVLKAVEFASKGNFVTFGIKPNRAETGFGYIEVGKELEDGAYITKAFREKPDILTAKKYLLSGQYYWNSGMFTFMADTYLQEIAKYESMIHKLFQLDYDQMVTKFFEMPDISIDYAVAEKSDIGVVIPLSLYWSDVGSWDAIYDVFDKDENGNAIKGQAVVINCKNDLFFSKNHVITGIGLDNIVVIENDNVILVARRGETQKVKKIVEKFKNNNSKKV